MHSLRIKQMIRGALKWLKKIPFAWIWNTKDVWKGFLKIVKNVKNRISKAIRPHSPLGHAPFRLPVTETINEIIGVINEIISEITARPKKWDKSAKLKDYTQPTNQRADQTEPGSIRPIGDQNRRTNRNSSQRWETKQNPSAQLRRRKEKKLLFAIERRIRREKKLSFGETKGK